MLSFPETMSYVHETAKIICMWISFLLMLMLKPLRFLEVISTYTVITDVITWHGWK